MSSPVAEANERPASGAPRDVRRSDVALASASRLAGSMLFTRVAYLVSTLAAARLEVADVAVWAIATAAVGMAELAADGGLGSRTLRDIAVGKRLDLRARTRLAVGLGAALSLGAIALVAATNRSAIPAAVVASLGIPAAGSRIVNSAALDATGQSGKRAWISAAAASGQIGAAVLLVLGGGVVPALAIASATQVLAAALASSAVQSIPIEQSSAETYPWLARTTAPFGAILLVSAIGARGDQIILGGLAGDAPLAAYAVASRLFEGTIGLLGAAQVPLLALLAAREAAAKDGDGTARPHEALASAAAVGAVLGSAAGMLLAAIVGIDRTSVVVPEASREPLALLACGLPAAFMVAVLGTGLLASRGGDTLRWAALVTSIGLAMSTAGAMHGARGAALATVAAQVIGALIFLGAMPKRTAALNRTVILGGATTCGALGAYGLGGSYAASVLMAISVLALGSTLWARRRARIKILARPLGGTRG